MLILYLILILILVLWGIKIKENDDYISRERCNAIKGIFILLIVLTHSMGYIDRCGYEYVGVDRLASMFRNGMGQMVVVMFLFYSGYGVSLSIRKKGKTYVNGMPRRRLLTTLLNFDVAVLAFVVLNLIIAKPMTISQIALSLTGWDSVGNSNWYIFDILLCYAASYVVAKCVKGKNFGLWLLLLMAVCMLVLSFIKDLYWYNTLLAYPAGAIFAEHQHKIVDNLRKYYYPLLIVLSGLFVVFFYLLPEMRGIADNIASVCFALIIVMLSMKIIIGNSFLHWCGDHLFPLYIYQRIPMIVMFECLGAEFVKHNALLFVLIALATTCAIAHFYKHWKISIS